MSMQPFFFIRSDNRCVKINFGEIIYIEACRNYIRIITDTQTYMCLLSMKQMESVLPHQQFCRIHRSYIVSLDRLLSFDIDTVTFTAGSKRQMLPIGLQYRKLLFDRVLVISSEVRQGSKMAGIWLNSLPSESAN